MTRKREIFQRFRPPSSTIRRGINRNVNVVRCKHGSRVLPLRRDAVIFVPAYATGVVFVDRLTYALSVGI